MAHFHPWRVLRHLPGIELHWVKMEGLLGATDGHRLIWLHPEQSQAQRRSTLAHELAHIYLGHVGGCEGSAERQATTLAAGWLIPLPLLLDAAAWVGAGGSTDELAEVLWVDVPTLVIRLAHLTGSELAAMRGRDAL